MIGKYAHLEGELRIKMGSLSDYGDLKRQVILADATARFSCVPRYLNVANELGLSDVGGEELRELYSEVIAPLNQKLFNIRYLVIGLRREFGFGENVPPLAELNQEDKDHALNEFVEFFESTMTKGDLRDKIGIKAVIIYPLFISFMNTWRKFDDSFASKLIESIRSKEPNEDLRGFIDAIDIPVSPFGEMHRDSRHI